MEQDNVAEDFGEITLKEERETGVNEECDELGELQPGQVSEIEILLHDVVHGGIRICPVHPLTSDACMIASKKIALIFLYGYIIFT